MLRESDIQDYLYKNLHLLPNWIGIDNLIEQYRPIRDDLIKKPAKYLFYKRIQKILDRMGRWYFSEESTLYKFPKEYITSEYWSSRPRVDILAHTPDPNTFWIWEVKYNKDPERQTLTELLQYANWLQINDFPWLPNDSIIFVIVAKDWSNILIQSAINCMLFRGLNILPLKISEEISSLQELNGESFSFYDISSTDIFSSFDQLIFNEDNYFYRLIAFDDHKSWLNFSVSNAEKQILCASIASKYTNLWYNGYIIFLENEPDHFFRFMFWIITFDPFLFENKNIPFCGKNECISRCMLLESSKKLCSFANKLDLLWKFHENENWDQFHIDESYAREEIELFFSDEISFESWDWGGRWLSGISESGNLFSYWYPVWWFHEIITDAMRFSKEDSIWGDNIFWRDDFQSRGEIYRWTYLHWLFNQENS